MPPDVFTRQERITNAISLYREALHLRSWDIRYEPKWDGRKDELATIQMDPYSRVGTLRIRKDVPDDYVDNAVGHELAHIVLQEYTLLTGDIIAKLGTAGEGILDSLKRIEERICEDIAYALSGQSYQPVGKKQSKWHKPFARTE